MLRLEKGCYLYQFGQYAWTHLILLFVFVPSSFFVSNIFDGIIWFLLPCSLVIINDIGAYLAGARKALRCQPYRVLGYMVISTCVHTREDRTPCNPYKLPCA